MTTKHTPRRKSREPTEREKRIFSLALWAAVQANVVSKSEAAWLKAHQSVMLPHGPLEGMSDERN